MTKHELLEHIAWLKIDTAHLKDEVKPGYLNALNRMQEYIEGRPTERQEAAKRLRDWIDFVHDKDASPNDTPYSSEEILEAMRMGAEELEKEEVQPIYVPSPPQFVYPYNNFCPISGGMCNNPHHDCYNCPWHNVTVGYTTTASSTIGEEKK